MKVRDVIKLVEQEGWRLDRTRGSHCHYANPEKPEAGTMTIAGHPSDEMRKGTLNAILKQAGLGMKYAVVIEKYEQGGYGAYVPDLPGCVAAAPTKRAIEKLIAEAISFHIECLQRHGHPVPAPSSEAEYVEPVAIAS